MGREEEDHQEEAARQEEEDRQEAAEVGQAAAQLHRACMETPRSSRTTHASLI